MTAKPTPAVPIAIVGLGCRYPGGVVDSASFWKLLIDDVDAISEIDRAGFDLDALYDEEPQVPGHMATRWGGFLDDVEHFDADFFGIAPREAETVSPEQRLLLESTWEAFEDAGIDAHSASGARVGVFIGQWISDFEQRVSSRLDEIDLYATTGSGRYASAGRVSYALGATGPSMTVDTACSSSLVAVHLACQSLRAGESTAAIAGGVNVILEPQISVAYSQSSMMAPDGHCKFGDASGDGYVRSEGAGVVLLKTLDRALADGDRIRAVIRGSAVNNDGTGSGQLAAPSRDGQAEMLRTAYADAGIGTDVVQYVEAHGTGTRAGDPIEFGAIHDVLCEQRPMSTPLYVGSIKTNIGHTEGAAGIAGLIKCVLSMEHGIIPTSLHHREPNPAVPWASTPIAVPTEPTPWPDLEGRPRCAGVSTFGITGTNAHVVLETPPELPTTETSLDRDDVTTHVVTDDAARPTFDSDECPLVISARSDGALRAVASAYAELANDTTPSALRDLCATAARHRAALRHRAVFVHGAGALPDGNADADAEPLQERLRRFAAGDDTAADVVATVSDDLTTVPAAFVFPGQGGQWAGMGRDLLDTQPAFRAAIEACDAALPADVEWSIAHILRTTDDATFDGFGISVTQPTLLAVEIALAALWQASGIAPSAAVGHSMGEIGAAYVGGVIGLDDAMSAICRRSALMQTVAGRGAMAVAELSDVDANERCAGVDGMLGVAVVNGSRSCVVSGDAGSVDDFVAGCERDGVFARRINVDVASHSEHMEPLVGDLVDALVGVTPTAERMMMFSSVDGGRRTDPWDGTYWGRNLRHPVRFGDAIEAMVDEGIGAFIEVGPHPTLVMSIDQHDGAVGIGSLRRHDPGATAMLRSIGSAWAKGVAVDWSRHFPTGSYQRVVLPHYPWQRQRHWADSVRALTGERSHAPARLAEDVQSWLHEYRWDPVEPAGATTITHWLIARPADDSAADAIATALKSRGATTVVTTPETDLVEQVVAAVAADPTTRLGLVLPPGSCPAAFDGIELLQRLQVALGADVSTPPRLFVVTEGVHGEGPPAGADVGDAALWGVGRTIRSEHPDWWGGLVDLTVAIGVENASALVDVLLADQSEDEIRIDGDRVEAVRFVATSEQAGQFDSYSWRPDVAYLVTGGFGGVGRHITERMVRDGARRLVLVTQQVLPPRDQWLELSGTDSDIGHRLAHLRSLEALGASVHVIHADVSDVAQMRGALERYHQQGWPPIGGVIHGAATLESTLMVELDRAAFDRAIRPKLGGAHVLDHLLGNVELFVMFSSVSAVLAPAGMAGYIAANVGLDGLADRRRRRGMHGLSIQWGPWADTGLHEHTVAERSMDDLEREGVGALTPQQGCDIFVNVLGRSAPMVAVLPIDWHVFHDARRARREALFSVATGGQISGAETDELVARITESSDQIRRELIENVVRSAVGAVLRLAPEAVDASRPFGAQGMDSLMALELRNRLEASLQRPLSATMAWNFPTVQALTRRLAELFAVADPTASSPTPGDGGAELTAAEDVDATTEDFDAFFDDVTDMSDDEAAAALRKGR